MFSDTIVSFFPVTPKMIPVTPHQTICYITKYCTKIDGNDAIFLPIHNEEMDTSAIEKADFLQNTEVTGSDIKEEKAIQNQTVAIIVKVFLMCLIVVVLQFYFRNNERKE
jgi:hypothetical protein